AFIQRRHELISDASCKEERSTEESERQGECDGSMPESPPQNRLVKPLQNTHDGVIFFAMNLAAKQQRAEDWNERYCHHGGAGHRGGLSECQRVKEFALLAGQSKNRNESEQNDRHREEDGPAH